MEFLKNYFKNVGQFVGRMTPSQVMMLFGVIAGTIVGSIFLVGWVTSISYSPLYSNLEEAEAGEAVQWLSDNKIPYQLTGGGNTIEVPSDQVHATRLAMASAGLPRSGTVGYSIFDQNNLGMTDFLQNLNFRRALEGELTRTITQLHEVQAARVHIVMPKERLFRDDQKEASASVVLKLAGGYGLSKQQVSGIAHLVAASVEGLKPQSIAILDYDGNLLSSGEESDPIAGLSGTQMEVRKNVERYLEDKAQTLLANVLGDDRSVVRVTAELDFNQIEKTSETYDPNSPSVRSEERTKNTNTSSDKSAETTESSEEGNSETTITNYELNKTIEHIVNGVGGIKRLSVAVMVDGTYKDVPKNDGSVESIYQPRSQEDLDRLNAIVRNAVGFDSERSDQIEIVNMPFDRMDMESERTALDSMYLREFYVDIAKKVGLVLLILLAALYLKRKSGKLFGALGHLMPPARPQMEPMAQMATMAQGIEEEEVRAVVPEKRRPTLVDQMQKTAKDQPDEIAKVIRTIMSE